MVAGRRRAEAPGRSAALLIGAVVLVLAAPAIGLKTGPPSPEQLPQDDPARQDAELIDRSDRRPASKPRSRSSPPPEKGRSPTPGASTPSTACRTGSRRSPGVQAGDRPGAGRRSGSSRCRSSATRLLASDGNIGPVKQLGRLGRNLGVAAGGVAQLRGGISEASAGRRPAGRGLRPGRRRGAADRQRPRPRGRRQRSGRSARSTSSRTAPNGSPKAQETAALGALQLKLAAHDHRRRQPPRQRAEPLAQGRKALERRSRTRRCRSCWRRRKVAERTAEGGARPAAGDDGRQDRPELRRRAGSRAPAPRRRSAAPTRSAASLRRRIHGPAGRTGSACRRGCSTTSKISKKSTD